VSVQITDADPETAARRIREKLGEDFTARLCEFLITPDVDLP
jgi:hypothetical protein